MWKCGESTKLSSLMRMRYMQSFGQAAQNRAQYLEAREEEKNEVSGIICSLAKRKFDGSFARLSVCLFDFCQFSKLIIWKPDSMCMCVARTVFGYFFCFDFSCFLAPSMYWLGRGSFSGSFCVNCCSINNKPTDNKSNSNKSKQVQEMSQAKANQSTLMAYGLLANIALQCL